MLDASREVGRSSWFWQATSTPRQKSLRFSLAGIRTAANANAMIDAASASLAIVRELGAPEFTPNAKT